MSLWLASNYKVCLRPAGLCRTTLSQLQELQHQELTQGRRGKVSLRINQCLLRQLEWKFAPIPTSTTYASGHTLTHLTNRLWLQLVWLGKAAS